MIDVLFARRLRAHGSRIALIGDNGVQLTYAALADAVDAQAAELAGAAQLAIIEAANTPACLIAYLACLQAGYPLILAEPGSTALDPRTAATYGAALVFRRSAQGEWRFEALETAAPPALHPDLCILLSTSGTTGSPKLVRLSHTNIQANSASIAAYLGLTPTDRAITSLPLYYSYGMSVVNSHLHAGATILMTQHSVADPAFWDFFAGAGATSLSGVPFTFDLLERSGFRERDYPALRYLAQAGGRLPAERVQLYGAWARDRGKQMFVMYGQTEASPRMAYVPPALLLENVEAIGIAVPGGSFELRGDDGETISTSDVAGELVYRGPNVMMGYAESAADLARGDETPALHTGDLACRKANGCYVITGRKSRFSKIVGLRISLDEIERWITASGLQGIVSGDDRLIVVAINGADPLHYPAQNLLQDLKARLVQRFGLPASALIVLAPDALPTLSSGKFDYRTLLRLGHEALAAPTFAPASLLEAYREVLGNADVRPGDSFLDLGGDSVNLVELSLVLENYLGKAPDNWEARPIAALEALKPADASGTPAPAPIRKREGLLQAAFVMLTLLFVGEALLQARSYMKSGRSAVAMFTGQSRVVLNERLGINTYRPNLKDPDTADGLEFTTNALGFRSPEIAPRPAAGELRIAVVGASTVAGAYARTNDDTFPQLLARRLRQAMPGQNINVINAGIEGYTVANIEQLIERAIIPLRPHVVVIYPGFNDMVQICRVSTASNSVVLQPLPAPVVPNWVLTRELISKNTVALRETPVRANRVDLDTHFPAAYGERLDSTVTKLKAAGITPVLMTVARAFKPGDGAGGKRLAATALFYNHCLDYEGLIQAGTMFNRTIADVAARQGVPLIDLGARMPSGPRHFADAAHFTREGEEFSSELIYRELVGNTTIARHLGLMASN